MFGEKISQEASAIIRGMSKAEVQNFLDHVTEIVIANQPCKTGVSLYKKGIEDEVNEVIEREALRFALRLKEEGERETTREVFRRDMAGRLTSRPVAVRSESGSESPSDILDRLSKKIMAEKGVDYNAGLLEAQRQRKDLAEAILKQLNEYRSR